MRPYRAFALALFCSAAAHARDTPRYESLQALPAAVATPLPCGKAAGIDCTYRVKLAREVVVWDLPLKRGSVAFDADEAHHGTLARDAQYKGVWLKGGTEFDLYVSWSGVLLRDQAFDGVPCKGGAKIGIDWKDRLAGCTLSAKYTLHDIEFPAGTVVTFGGDDHHVNAATPPVSLSVRGRDYPAGKALRFDDTGTILPGD